MANTGMPLELPYLEDNERAPEIPWREAMDKINAAVLGGGGSLSIVRKEARVTTSSLASLARDGGKRIELGMGGIIYAVSTTRPAWVTIYTGSKALEDDEERPISQDPISGAGVLAEVVTSMAKSTIAMSPPAAYWNNEYPFANTLPLAVTNYDQEEGEVTVIVHYLEIESGTIAD